MSLFVAVLKAFVGLLLAVFGIAASLLNFAVQEQRKQVKCHDRRIPQEEVAEMVAKTPDYLLKDGLRDVADKGSDRPAFDMTLTEYRRTYE